MVSDLRVAVRVRTGSYRLVDENGSVVAGDWANADRASGPASADHGEHELEGVPGAWRIFAVKG
jgi:hypothetical protein